MLEVITVISSAGKRKLGKCKSQDLKEGTKEVPPLPRISNTSDTEEVGDLKVTEIFEPSTVNNKF